MNGFKRGALGLLAGLLLAGCGQVSAPDIDADEELMGEPQDVFAITRRDEAVSEPETRTTTIVTAAETETETTTTTSETTTTTTTTTAQETEVQYYEPVTEEQSNEAPQETQAAQTEATQAVSEAPAAAPVGVYKDGDITSTGKTVKVVDGLTYIDDILVVNKTYSLPSSYVPENSGLTSECYSAYLELRDAAARDGYDLPIASGYRSYWTQQDLYNNYYWYYGWYSEADRFSARPGHSEHQTGMAIDLVQASRYTIGWPVMDWIEAHCVEYGFIVRYPEGKEDITGFMYEPWHVRYLGKEKAKAVADSGLTLEEYLGIDSVYRD